MNVRHARTVVTMLTVSGLVFAGAVAYFLFIPTFKEVFRLSSDITRAYAELGAQYANRKNLLSSLDKAQETHASMQRLATQFVPAGRELDFITSVESLAAKDGVEERVTLSPIDGSKAAEELRENYELTIDGKYRSVMQMLVDLEKMPALLFVSDMSIRPSPGATPADPSFLSVVMHGSMATPPNGL